MRQYADANVKEGLDDLIQEDIIDQVLNGLMIDLDDTNEKKFYKDCLKYIIKQLQAEIKN